MDFCKKLNTTEKAMIGALILMLLLVALNWKQVFKGIQKGIEPYNNNTKTEVNE